MVQIACERGRFFRAAGFSRQPSPSNQQQKLRTSKNGFPAIDYKQEAFLITAGLFKLHSGPESFKEAGRKK